MWMFCPHSWLFLFHFFWGGAVGNYIVLFRFIWFVTVCPLPCPFLVYFSELVGCPVAFLGMVFISRSGEMVEWEDILFVWFRILMRCLFYSLIIYNSFGPLLRINMSSVNMLGASSRYWWLSGCRCCCMHGGVDCPEIIKFKVVYNYLQFEDL